MSNAWLRSGVDALVLLVEAAGAVVIFVGVVLAALQFIRVLPLVVTRKFAAVRLTLGRFLAPCLRLQLAGDVLRTAMAPSFDESRKLAAVAAIGTALNKFLALEIREEQELEGTGPSPRTGAPGAGELQSLSCLMASGGAIPGLSSLPPKVGWHLPSPCCWKCCWARACCGSVRTHHGALWAPQRRRHPPQAGEYDVRSGHSSGFVERRSSPRTG
jgi:uncharacterized membrane protein